MISSMGSIMNLDRYHSWVAQIKKDNLILGLDADTGIVGYLSDKSQEGIVNVAENC
jgi:hypothetical protein